MLDTGLLAKLKIIPFEASESVQDPEPAGPAFIAQFNPETFSIKKELNIGPRVSVPGEMGQEAKFDSIKSREFSLDLLLDGTGASGTPLDVLSKIKEFEKTVGYSGKIHRTKFLIVQWGDFIETCVMEGYSINYKLFRPDGTPLRVVISASFKEHKPKKKQELEKNQSSPDLTHLHTVRGKEHLSLITHQIYKDPAYYFQVGEFNHLNNLRELNTGTSLRLPPLKVNEEKPS